MAASIKRLPLVVVLGATGSGKSKLALEIGKIFNGEIISADSMQVYKGLDIITNKVTKEELQQCPHHMIDYLDPLKEDNTVVDYRDMAVPIIDQIFQSNKIPIIVGGTNYYIESLMWKFLLNKQDIEKAANIDPTDTSKNYNVSNEEKDAYRRELEKEDSVVLHRRLMEVDRKRGESIHPHNKRRIIRALEVYDRYGIGMSKIFEYQKAETGENSLRGDLRYNNTCIFWIQSDQPVLDERTDKRVDEMLGRGLIEEMQDFHKKYNTKRIQENNKVDYTHGIFQSIGFKEFHDYLILPEDEKDTQKGKDLLQFGIDEMKLVTRRYARSQVRWIRRRFLTDRGAYVPPIYGLDSTDVSQWEEHVHEPAVRILKAVIEGHKPDVEPLPVETSYNTSIYNTCDICNMTFTRIIEWQAHMKGKKHHHQVRAIKRRELFEAYKRRLKEENKTSNEESAVKHSYSVDEMIGPETLFGDELINDENVDKLVAKIDVSNNS